MERDWFMDDVALRGGRVPVAVEFYKWASSERRHDRHDFDDRSGEARVIHTRPAADFRPVCPRP